MVRAVEDEVVVLEDGDCVGGGESEVVGYVGGVWVESGAWLAIEGKGGREGECTGVGRAVLIRPWESQRLRSSAGSAGAGSTLRRRRGQPVRLCRYRRRQDMQRRDTRGRRHPRRGLWHA